MNKIFNLIFGCIVFLCPELMSLATMSGVLWAVHSPDVVSYKALDVLLSSIMDADVVTAVEYMESIEISRIGFVNIELHMFFVLNVSVEIFCVLVV